MSASACDLQLKMPSGLLKELNSLPVVHTASSMLASAQKESRLFRSGVAIFEYSITAVLSRVPGGSSLLSSFDSVAEKGLVSLKERYPTITHSPEQLQGAAYGSVRKTVRAAMRTPPGRVILSGLDWTLDKSLAALKRLDKNLRTELAAPSVSRDHAYASEDSGAYDTERRPTREAQIALSALTEKDSLMRKAFKLGVVFPLEKVVSTLLHVRRYVGGNRRREKPSAGRDSSNAGKRVIKSPRKRLQSTFWSRMKNTMFNLLGAKSEGRAFVLWSVGQGPSSPGNPERKRPHDEILSESGSESDDNLRDFDLDNYDSEDDPDYVNPDKDSGEDSDGDTSDGQPESDFDEIMEEARQFVGKAADHRKKPAKDTKQPQQERNKNDGILTENKTLQGPIKKEGLLIDPKKTQQEPNKNEGKDSKPGKMNETTGKDNKTESKPKNPTVLLHDFVSDSKV